MRVRWNGSTQGTGPILELLWASSRWPKMRYRAGRLSCAGDTRGPRVGRYRGGEGEKKQGHGNAPCRMSAGLDRDGALSAAVPDGGRPRRKPQSTGGDFGEQLSEVIAKTGNKSRERYSTMREGCITCGQETGDDDGAFPLRAGASANATSQDRQSSRGRPRKMSHLNMKG